MATSNNKVMKNKYPRNQNNGLELSILIFSICMVLGLYWRWLLPGAITWGDWFYFTKSNIWNFVPSLWYARSGLGSCIITSIPFNPIVMLLGFLGRTFNLDYSIIERLVIFGPYFIFLVFSPWYLARTLGFGRIATAAVILVFNLNSSVFLNTTVALTALADAISPLVFALFIRALRHPDIKKGLWFGLFLALQIAVEIRSFYTAIFLCGLYFFYCIAIEPQIYQNLWRIGKVFIFSTFIILLLHSYWIIPLLFGKTTAGTYNLIPEGYKSASALEGLSYMTLLHSVGLSSPFWGRTGILNPVNPQFLLLPMIAFSVLLFGKQKRTIIFFALSALIFSFLVKGSRAPLGGINVWLFLHFPGFFMFRTPGKWYLPLIISYAVLIGCLAEQFISQKFMNDVFLDLKKRFNLRPFIIKTGMFISAVAVIFIVFPVQPISALHYSAIFKPIPVPEEFSHFEQFFNSQDYFFRTLWIPTPYRFADFSIKHPALVGIELGQGMLSSLCTGDLRYGSYIFSYLGKSFSLEILRLFSLKYIIVPRAPQGEPFIHYWHDFPPEYYQQVVEATPDIIPVSFEGKSKIYELPNPLPHLYATSINNLVMGNYNDILPPIVKGGFLGAKPGIIISGQNLLSTDSLLSSENFTLQDRNIMDLIVENVKSTKIPVSISDNKNKQRLQLRIKKAGTYEFWIDYSEDKSKDGLFLPLRITLDKKIVYSEGQDLILEGEEQGLKYFKLIALKLEPGRHLFEIQANTEDNSSAITPNRILLIDNSERLKIKDLVYTKIKQSRAGLSYIFSKSAYFRVE